MKRIFYFIAILAALAGCKRSEIEGGGGANGEPTIRLTPTFVTSHSSRVTSTKATETAFENGDRVGIYLTKLDVPLRRSFNAMDNRLFEYFESGDSLAGVPRAVFYPDKTTPVAVYAYYPFAPNINNALALPFQVTTDLKASDLCYAKLPTAAPSATSQPLQFVHSLSKLTVNVDFTANDKIESVTSITLLNILDSCYLNLNTGAVINGTHVSDMLGNTFILPPQTLHTGKLFRVVCKLKDGTTEEFHLEPTISPLTLLQSKKHTITLIIFAGGSIALSDNQPINDWTEAVGKGEMEKEKVDNRVTIHWLGANKFYRNIANIRLYIRDNSAEITPITISDFLFDPTSSQNRASFIFNIKDYDWLKYPYTIESVEYLSSESALIQSSRRLVGETIYRQGDIAIANNTQIETVDIGGIEWLATNLDGVAGQADNLYISDFPQDYGKFFKWGDRWVYDRIASTTDGKWSEYTSDAATMPAASYTGGLGYDYNYGVSLGRASGDPCKALGVNYQTPTHAQLQVLVAAGQSTWTTYQNVNGYFFGPKAAQCDNTTLQDGCIFIPAAGFRHYSDGSLNAEGAHGDYWSSSVCSSPDGHSLGFLSDYVNPNTSGYRGHGLSVRCIRTAVPDPLPAIDVKINSPAQSVAPAATSASFTVTAASNPLGLTYYNINAGANATTVTPSGQQTIAVAGGHSQAVTVGFTANTGAQRNIVTDIVYGASLKLTHTVTQAAAALSLSAYAANVGVDATSTAFTLTSNVPYASAYSAGGTSSQGVGNTPPYNNTNVTFSFPAQGAAAAVARNHTMTITPNPNNSASSQIRTFTATQAARNPTLSLSATGPGETVPKVGKTYYINVTTNSPWNTTGASNLSVNPASGTGTVNSVAVTVASTSQSSTRSVSVAFNTTFGNGLAAVSSTWSGTQQAAELSVKWASANLGASSPQQYGNFYKWGDTFAYSHASSTTDGMKGTNVGNASKFPAASGTSNLGYDYGLGLSGGRASGDPCKSLGSNWRTPTRAQFQELVASGQSAWTTYQNVNGYFFGPSATSCTNTTIQPGCYFFPAAGFREWSGGSLIGEGSNGFYWSSSVHDRTDCHGLYFDSGSGSVSPGDSYFRGYGLSVRCVQE